jgi:integrase/recombinase XerD
MHLRQNKLTKRSVNRKLSAVRTFFKFLKEKEFISKNPSLFLGNSEFNPKMPVILEPGEIEELRSVIPEVKMNNFRDRLIIELLYSSGIRANELLLLNEKFIDIENRELRIINQNKQERLTFFSKTARYYLIKYLEAKKKKFGDKYKSDIVFVNNSNERLSDRSLRRIIDRIAKRTDIQKEISPHTFRHSFAVYMLRHGMNIHYLQELMGHTSLESTKIYVDIDGRNEIFEDKSFL